MTVDWEPHEVASQHRHEAAAARSRVWAWIGGVIIGTAILMVAFAAGAQWLQASRWDPLGDYPLQTVFTGATLPSATAPTTITGGSTGTGPPTFYIDQSINSFGTKCVKPGEGVQPDEVAATTTVPTTTTVPGATTTSLTIPPTIPHTPPLVAGTVQVKGTLSWVSDNPPGRIIEVRNGGGTRGPGCVSSTFRNPIPEVIQQEILRLAAEGVYQSDWHLTGTEFPIRTVDGVEERGEPRTWVSTTFRVLPIEAP